MKILTHGNEIFCCKNICEKYYVSNNGTCSDFWTCQETRLQPWEEAIGNYESLKISEDRVTLTLTYTARNLAISFPKDTPEAQTLIQTLKKTPKGTKIALLKTDIPEKPLIIKNLTATPIADKNSCPRLQCRKSIFSVAFKVVAFKFSLWLFGLRLRGWF